MAQTSFRSIPADMTLFLDDLMAKMTLQDMIGQLNLVAPGGFSPTGPVVSENVAEHIRDGKVGGILNMVTFSAIREAQETAVHESRLGIPLLFGLDVIHGHKTIFPIPLALSCTWNPECIEATARIAAREATADGLNWLYSPMVDISRDPRWGRIAEGSGEDPVLGSVLAAAMVRGYQGQDLSAPDTALACVKHFALYGASEAGRDYNTVDMSRPSMFNYYMKPYQAAIEAGAGSVMTSFNVVEEVPATANTWLMRDVLRHQYGFDGLVVTDYTAINEMMAHGLGDLEHLSALSLEATVDMDMVGEGFLKTLEDSVESGRIQPAQIERACRRVLEAKYRLGLFEDPFRYLNEARQTTDMLTPEHRALARKAAAESCVLLKNDANVLPLQKSGKIAIIGALADSPKDLLGTWVMTGNPEDVVTIWAGIQRAVGSDAIVQYAKGSNITDDGFMLNRVNYGGFTFVPQSDQTPETMRAEAVQIASESDVVVAVLGESQNMSGESACRSDLGLPESQRLLLDALVQTGKPVVLVLVAGRPLTIAQELESVDAAIMAWAGGTEAGNGLADVLFGAVNPSGKLTMTFPCNVGQIPIYYNHKRTGRPYLGAETKYTSTYLDIPNTPLFPFGFGLSYTTFAYGKIHLSQTELNASDILDVAIEVTNTGQHTGEEVVQLYISDPAASIARPVQELKHFQKIHLKAGESQRVAFRITPEDLKFYNQQLVYDWEGGTFGIHIGSHSEAVQTAEVIWRK